MRLESVNVLCSKRGRVGAMESGQALVPHSLGILSWLYCFLMVSLPPGAHDTVSVKWVQSKWQGLW